MSHPDEGKRVRIVRNGKTGTVTHVGRSGVLYVRLRTGRLVSVKRWSVTFLELEPVA